MVNENYKIAELDNSTYAVLFEEDDKVILAQEHWRKDPNKEIRISLTKEQILKLADEIKKSEL